MWQVLVKYRICADILLYPVVQDMYRVTSCGGY